MYIGWSSVDDRRWAGRVNFFCKRTLQTMLELFGKKDIQRVSLSQIEYQVGGNQNATLGGITVQMQVVRTIGTYIRYIHEYIVTLRKTTFLPPTTVLHLSRGSCTYNPTFDTFRQIQPLASPIWSWWEKKKEKSLDLIASVFPKSCQEILRGKKKLPRNAVFLTRLRLYSFVIRGMVEL